MKVVRKEAPFIPSLARLRMSSVTPQARKLTQHARRSYGAAITPSNPTAVYANGKLIGQDPDANVRMMLQKDFIYQ